MFKTLFKADGELMLINVVESARSRVLKIFPDRQIYLRSGGEVTYYSLSSKLQIILIGALSIMFLWSIVSLTNLFIGPNPFLSQNEQIKQVEDHYQRLLADSRAKEIHAQSKLAEQRETFEMMTASLEAKHQTISQIMNVGAFGTPDDNISMDYAGTKIVMAPTIRDGQERVARRNALRSPVTETGLPIDTTLTAMDDSQSQILMTAEAELLERIDFNRALITATGVGLDALLDERTGGQGGPFIPLDGDSDLTDGRDFQPRLTAIQARVTEAQLLDEVVSTIPLFHPVEDETAMSSDFGVRSDPFTKRPTFHQGLDFLGRADAPIVATAPGTVRFAGRKGSFGRMVEIDHGNGFISRYAHLKSTVVKRGQKVETGDKIGGMGTTGRSTGVHLHYEVHFQGRAYDPKDFLKAGLYVQ